MRSLRRAPAGTAGPRRAPHGTGAGRDAARSLCSEEQTGPAGATEQALGDASLLIRNVDGYFFSLLFQFISVSAQFMNFHLFSSP